MSPVPPAVPREVLSELEPGEAVEASFDMGAGLAIYATDRRFFGQRGDRLIDVRYGEVTDARRRTSDWRTRGGGLRIATGVVFLAAGVLTGFATPEATIISLGLFLVGGGFVFLGLYRRDDWVELKIDRREPLPSFWYLVVFLPFWLMTQSRKRYRVAGDPEDVDAFYSYLTDRLAYRQKTVP